MVVVIKKMVPGSKKNALSETSSKQLISTKAAQLSKLIKMIIDAEPFEHNGYKWAKRAQSWWTSELGFSVETLRRYLSHPPFVRECILDPDNGKKVTLIREGLPGPKTKKHVQNILAKIWLAKTGRRIVGVQYGHIGGLVDAWGIDNAPIIFKLVLSDVPAFMAGAKIKIAQLGDAGYMRYFNNYPPTGFILRFNEIGIEMYVMKQQATYALHKGHDAHIPF